VNIPRELDVREIASRFRHPLIFSTFDGLRSGDWFVLVNDHDPRPLYYQFEAERHDQFRWEHWPPARRNGRCGLRGRRDSPCRQPRWGGR
jgi:uncharacterized protein (DUF2249 family)